MGGIVQFEREGAPVPPELERVVRRMVEDGATRVRGKWCPETGEFDFEAVRAPQRLAYGIEEVSELLGEGYSVSTLRRLVDRRPGKAPVLSSATPGRERVFFLPLLVRDILRRGDFPDDLSEAEAIRLVLDHSDGRAAG